MRRRCEASQAVWQILIRPDRSPCREDPRCIKPYPNRAATRGAGNPASRPSQRTPARRDLVAAYLGQGNGKSPARQWCGPARGGDPTGAPPCVTLDPLRDEAGTVMPRDAGSLPSLGSSNTQPCRCLSL